MLPVDLLHHHSLYHVLVVALFTLGIPSVNDEHLVYGSAATHAVAARPDGSEDATVLPLAPFDSLVVQADIVEVGFIL